MIRRKGLWISSQGEDLTDLGKGESLDTPNPMEAKFESKERNDERPVRLFQSYTRKNKDAKEKHYFLLY